MYYNTGYPYTPYNQPAGPSYGQYNQQPAPMQQIKPVQKQVTTYSVGSEDELRSLAPDPLTLFVGVNTNGKEIYTKSMDNDGKPVVGRYVLAEGVKERTPYDTILERLDRIESKLKGEANEQPTRDSTTGNVGSDAK